MSSLDLVEVHKTFPKGGRVLDGVTLGVRGGERFVLLGASGSGKTTLLRIAAGLESPDEGEVLIEGASVRDVPPERRDVGLVFQRPLLFPHLTVGGNLAFGLTLRRANRSDIDRRVRELLDLVNLAGFESRRPQQLSGGQESRVALARALATSPKVLLLDEPFSALDTRLRSEMRDVVKSLQERLGTTLVLVTHDLEDALALGDRLGVLHEGRLLQVGPPRSFFDTPATLDVAKYMGGVNFIDGEQDGSVVRTGIGVFRSSSDRRGQVVLTVRPEAFQEGEANENTLRGRIVKAEYGGAFLRYDVRSGNDVLRWHAPPHVTRTVGEDVTLHVPRVACWTVPSRSTLTP